MTDSITETSGAQRSFDWSIAAVAGIALLARLYLLFTTHRTAEDFYITLRYAENIAHGNGFVYNIGQRVLGTTTPLYTLVLALAEWLGANATLAGQLLNAGADALSCWLIYRLARAAMPGETSVGLLAAAILAIWPPSLYWAISGMETGIVTFLGLAVFTCLAERRPLPMAVSAALLVLTRIDGLAIAGIAFGAWAWHLRGKGSGSERSSLARAATLFVLLLLPWMIFAAVYFGSPVPTSLAAKLRVYAWQNPGRLPNLIPFARDMSRNALYLVLLAGALPGIIAALRKYDRLRPALIWMLIYYSGMALSKSFLFGWYFVPPAPIYILSSVAGWIWTVEMARKSVWRAAESESPRGPLVYHVGAGAILLAGCVLLSKQRALISADQKQDEALLKSAGEYLRTCIRPGESLMLEPIGWIGYYSRAKVLDAVGLVSPEVIPFFRPSAASPYLDIMRELRPDWVLLRTGEFDNAMTAAVPPDRRLLSSYLLVREIPNPAAPRSRPAFFLLRRKQ